MTTKGKRATLYFVALGFLVLIALGVRTLSSTEAYGHLAMGRWMQQHGGVMRADAFSYTRAGTPTVNTAWLYDRLLLALWDAGGAELATLVHVAAAALAFLLLVPVARRWAGDLAIGAALLLCAWVLAPRLVVSPTVFCLPLAAFFLWMLAEHRDHRLTWPLLLAAQVLWANLHASFLIGPLLALLAAVETWQDERAGGPAPAPAGEHKRLGAVLALAVVLVVVSAINPFHVAIFRQAFTEWTDPVYKFTQEWISPFFNQFQTPFQPSRFLMLALLVGVVGFVAEKRRLPLVVCGVAVVFAALTLQSMSQWLVLFALLSFPFLALSLHALQAALREQLAKRGGGAAPAWLLPAERAVALALVAGSLYLVVSNRYYRVTGYASTFGLGAVEDVVPASLAAAAGHTDFPQRLVNLAVDGGYLSWRYPDHQVFTDQRASLYGREFYDDLARCLTKGGAQCAWIEDEWHPDAILFNCCWSAAGYALKALTEDGAWRMVYFDGTTALLRPSGSRTPMDEIKAMRAGGLRILEQERKDYQARLQAGRGPFNSARLVGAGNVYFALGRYREAEAIYGLLARGTPTMASAWIGLGISQVKLGRAKEGVANLQQAARMAPKNLLVWVWLSRGYRQLHAEKEANEAYQKARLLDAAAADQLMRE